MVKGAAGHGQEYTICRAGRTRRDDRRRGREGPRTVRGLGTIPNRPEPVRRLLGKLDKAGELRVCYEAGPTGYALYWQLTAMGIACEVIAPSLGPSQAWRPGQDGSSGRGAARELVSGRHADSGVGP